MNMEDSTSSDLDDCMKLYYEDDTSSSSHCSTEFMRASYGTAIISNYASTTAANSDLTQGDDGAILSCKLAQHERPREVSTPIPGINHLESWEVTSLSPVPTYPLNSGAQGSNLHSICSDSEFPNRLFFHQATSWSTMESTRTNSDSYGIIENSICMHAKQLPRAKNIMQNQVAVNGAPPSEWCPVKLPQLLKEGSSVKQCDTNLIKESSKQQSDSLGHTEQNIKDSNKVASKSIPQTSKILLTTENIKNKSNYPSYKNSSNSLSETSTKVTDKISPHPVLGILSTELHCTDLQGGGANGEPVVYNETNMADKTNESNSKISVTSDTLNTITVSNEKNNKKVCESNLANINNNDNSKVTKVSCDVKTITENKNKFRNSTNEITKSKASMPSSDVKRDNKKHKKQICATTSAKEYKEKASKGNKNCDSISANKDDTNNSDAMMPNDKENEKKKYKSKNEPEATVLSTVTLPSLDKNGDKTDGNNCGEDTIFYKNKVENWLFYNQDYPMSEEEIENQIEGNHCSKDLNSHDVLKKCTLKHSEAHLNTVSIVKEPGVFEVKNKTKKRRNIQAISNLAKKNIPTKKLTFCARQKYKTQRDTKNKEPDAAAAICATKQNKIEKDSSLMDIRYQNDESCFLRIVPRPTKRKIVYIGPEKILQLTASSDCLGRI